VNVGGVGGARGYDRAGESEGADEAQAAKEAEAPALPRSGWQDKGALSKAVVRTMSKVAADASRPNHRTKWVDAKRTGGARTEGADMPTHVAIALGRGGKTTGTKGAGKTTTPDKPVIAAKYGLAPNTGGTTTPDKPVIAAKYGLAPNTGGTTTPDKPVIAAKYGLAPNTGGTTTPDKPVIAAKYGLAPNTGGNDTPDRPVIAAKYGLAPRR